MDRALKARLERRFGDSLTGPIRQRHDETEMRIGPGDVTQVITALHDEPEFDFEFWPTWPAWTRATSCRSCTTSGAATTPDWLRVIADGLPREDPRVPSVTFLWNGAEWMEREAYDMFGITFEGNRDLRRIYMPPDYTSFPLRKDFFLADDAARSPGARRPPHGTDPHARATAATATVGALRPAKA